MIEAMLAALQARWETFGTWTWADPRHDTSVGGEHFVKASVVSTPCSHSTPYGLSTKIIDTPCDLQK